MTESRGITIFLAHASGDKAAVLALYERLKEQGYSPWLDKKNLIAGQNWREEIPKAIKSSDIVIACLSKQSVTKQGYVQQELRLALTEYSQKPPGSIYLIPLKLEPCDVPNVQHAQVGVSFLDLHWLDYWEADGFSELLRAIEYGRESSPSPPESSTGKFERFSFEVVTVDAKGQEMLRRTAHADHFLEKLDGDIFLDMVRIPGGKFLMGSPQYEPGRYDTEGPQHSVVVPEFFIGRYPVTQAQWRVVACLEPVTRKLDTDPSAFKGSKRPVENVSWDSALEFCYRLTRLSGQAYGLPSESQWEYACRGRTDSPFYFGDILTQNLAIYNDAQTTNPGEFPPNLFGLYDMHGNVWEWCFDYWYDNYNSFHLNHDRKDRSNKLKHVIRGGAWNDDFQHCRSACRFGLPSGTKDSSIGFRVVSLLGQNTKLNW